MQPLAILTVELSGSMGTGMWATSPDDRTADDYGLMKWTEATICSSAARAAGSSAGNPMVK